MLGCLFKIKNLLLNNNDNNTKPTSNIRFRRLCHDDSDSESDDDDDDILLELDELLDHSSSLSYSCRCPQVPVDIILSPHTL